MKQDEFITRAKAILEQAGTEFDCYHEASLTGAANQELYAQLYYAKDNRYMTFTYTPEIAPCQDVLKMGELCIHEKVIDKYPEDKGLSYVKAEAYIGIKTANGLCALLSPEPISSCTKQLNLLKNQ